MLRETIVKAQDKQGWTLLRLSQESGVPYGRLHEWVRGVSDTINSGHIEKLMKALKLKVVGGSKPGRPARKAAK